MRFAWLLAALVAGACSSQRQTDGGSADLAPCALGPSDCFTKKYFLLIYNPVLESQGKRLVEHLGWNNPDTLAAKYAAEVHVASHSVVTYVQAGRLELDEFPVKADGFIYDDASYLACWSDHSTCHEPDGVNYGALLARHRVCEKLNSGELDELWVFGGPWFGFWEANQAGTGAFFTNGPVIDGTTCNRILSIMGFSYERGLSEMEEDLGHRVEGTMKHVYGAVDSTFAKFTRYEKVAPGGAQCGSVHFAPNSASDYDWGNTTPVTSACDDWYDYPTLKGAAKTVTCSDWQCKAHQHKLWWLGHVPHAPGMASDGKRANWWSFVVDYGK
jgi:hypothetical protein